MLSTSPGLAESPASSADDSDLHWESPTASQQDDAFEPEPAIGSGPEVASDLPLGASYGLTDDPDQLLAQLQKQGVLETDSLSPAETNPAWTQASELPRTRVGRALLILWVSTMVLLGGGYFGFQQWVEYRHSQADQLLAQARDAAWDGDQAQLAQAERLVNAAREKNPRSTAIPERALLLQAQRLLENGSRELTALRLATARAKQAGASEAHVKLAEALLAAFGGTADTALLAAASELAGKSSRDKSELLYVAGRAAQRLGQSGAIEQLQAVEAEAPKLLAAPLALAEIAHVEGRTEDALAQVQRVLAARPDHLRARLWKAYLTADQQDPQAALPGLTELEHAASTAAPIDRMLVALAKARLLQRKGEREAAAQAVSSALATGTSEPSLLALLAVEAERTGQLGVASQAARAALAAAPSSPTYRALLARILLARRDAASALALLNELPAGDPNIVILRARAALGSDDAAQQRDALAALEAQLGAAPDAPNALQARALKLRLQAALEPSAKLVREAEKLSAKAPGDAQVLQALGEVALAAANASVAKKALDQLVLAAPDDAEAFYLQGRARRLAADAKGAEQSFLRALELAPGHPDASIALGALLLDSGRYADADALYQQLASTSPMAARLGRVEALTGLHQYADASVQLQGVPEAQRSSAVARETAARLALASGKPGEAVTLLSPLMQAEKRSPLALALYGDALYGVEQVDAAAGAFEAALALDADLPEALIGRAEVHLRAERPDDALELLEQAQEALTKRLRAPEWHARALTDIGRAHVMRGKRNDLETARNALLKALELQGVPNEAYFWRGEADGGRRTPEAAAAFKKYLELEPKGQYAERAKKALGPLL